MPSRNQIPAAAGTPKSVPEPFSIKRARSTGSVATQYQSDLGPVDIQVDNGFPTPLKFVFKVARRR